MVYIITAANGSEQNYDVNWEISQRNILLTLYNENPENTMDWDLENPDISTWEGVITDAEGNVTELYLTGRNIQNIPEIIDRFMELTQLGLSHNTIIKIPVPAVQLLVLK
ncbi:hypothetical protein [Allomuricauda sp. R78024]|uniref:hypothetical protein n=1 Tax=Allomuricauda sp. R78024 TaxID=3093867 RepID=UPI0037C67672